MAATNKTQQTQSQTGTTTSTILREILARPQTRGTMAENFWEGIDTINTIGNGIAQSGLHPIDTLKQSIKGLYNLADNTSKIITLDRDGTGRKYFVDIAKGWDTLSQNTHHPDRTVRVQAKADLLQMGITVGAGKLLAGSGLFGRMRGGECCKFG